MSEIEVSMLCCTHNHEKFVRDAINGMLNQKVPFKYEILIRDDASTDGTVEILKEYEAKYPDIIKVYCETENQRSIGVRRCIHILMRRAKGKYIALCDGDDYWIDPKKIINQYDYMEEHDDCQMVVTDAVRYNESTGGFEEHFYTKGVPCDYRLKDIAPVQRPASTSTFFFRNGQKEPDWYFRTIIGDTPLLLLRTYRGYLHYMPKTTTVYRIGTGTSNMDERTKHSPEQKILNNMEFIWMYDLLNKETKYECDKEFGQRISDLLYGTGLLAVNNGIKVPKIVYQRLKLSKRIKMHIREWFKMKKQMSADSKPLS